MTDKTDLAAARALCDEMEKLAEKATKGPWLASGRAMAGQSVTIPDPQLGLVVLAKDSWCCG